MDRIRLDRRLRTPQTSERAILPGELVLGVKPNIPNVLLDKRGGVAEEEPWMRAQIAAQRWWEAGRWWQRAPGLPEQSGVGAERPEDNAAGAAWKRAAAATAAAGAGVAAGAVGAAAATGVGAGAGDLWQRVLSDENFRLRVRNYPAATTHPAAPTPSAWTGDATRQPTLACDVEDRLIDDLEPEPSLWQYSRLLKREMSRHRRQTLLQRRLQRFEEHSFPPLPQLPPSSPPPPPPTPASLPLKTTFLPIKGTSKAANTMQGSISSRKEDVNEFFRRTTPQNVVRRLTTATVAVFPAAATGNMLSCTSSCTSFRSSTPQSPATDGDRENALGETRSDPIRFTAPLMLDCSADKQKAKVKVKDKSVVRAPARRATECPIGRRTYEVGTQWSGPSTYNSETDTADMSTREGDTSAEVRGIKPEGCSFLVDSCTSTPDARIAPLSKTVTDSRECQEYGPSHFSSEELEKMAFGEEEEREDGRPVRRESSSGGKVSRLQRGQLMDSATASSVPTDSPSSTDHQAQRSNSSIMCGHLSLKPGQPLPVPVTSLGNRSRMSRWRSHDPSGRSPSPSPVAKARAAHVGPMLPFSSPPPLPIVASKSGNLLHNVESTVSRTHWEDASQRRWSPVRPPPATTKDSNTETSPNALVEETGDEDEWVEVPELPGAAHMYQPMSAAHHRVGTGAANRPRRWIGVSGLRHRKQLGLGSLASQRAAAHTAAAECERGGRGTFPLHSNVLPPPPSFSEAAPRRLAAWAAQNVPTPSAEPRAARGVSSVTAMAVATKLAPQGTKMKDELLYAMNNFKRTDELSARNPSASSHCPAAVENLESRARMVNTGVGSSPDETPLASLKASLLSCSPTKWEQGSHMKLEDRMRLHLRAKYQRTVETLKLKMRIAKHREREQERRRARLRTRSKSRGARPRSQGKIQENAASVSGERNTTNSEEPPTPPSSPIRNRSRSVLFTRPETSSNQVRTKSAQPSTEKPSGKGGQATKRTQGGRRIWPPSNYTKESPTEEPVADAHPTTPAPVPPPTTPASDFLPSTPTPVTSPFSTTTTTDASTRLNFSVDVTALKTSVKGAQGRRSLRKRRHSKRRGAGLLSLQQLKQSPAPVEADTSPVDDASDTSAVGVAEKGTYTLHSKSSPQHFIWNKTTSLESVVESHGKDLTEIPTAERLFGKDEPYLENTSDAVFSRPGSRGRASDSASKGSRELISINGDGVETSVGSYCPLTMVDPCKHYAQARVELDKKTKELQWLCDKTFSPLDDQAADTTLTFVHASATLKSAHLEPIQKPGGTTLRDTESTNNLAMIPTKPFRPSSPRGKKEGKDRSLSPLPGYTVHLDKSVEIIGDVHLPWESCKGLKFRIKPSEPPARALLTGKPPRRGRNKEGLRCVRTRKRDRSPKPREAKKSPSPSTSTSLKSGSFQNCDSSQDQKMAREALQMTLTSAHEYALRSEMMGEPERNRPLSPKMSPKKSSTQSPPLPRQLSAPPPTSLSAIALNDEEKCIPFSKCNPQASAARRAFRTVMEGVGALVKTPSNPRAAQLSRSRLRTTTLRRKEDPAAAGESTLSRTLSPTSVPITTLPSFSGSKIQRAGSITKSKPGSPETKQPAAKRSTRNATSVEGTDKNSKTGMTQQKNTEAIPGLVNGSEKDSKFLSASPTDLKTEISSKSPSKKEKEPTSLGSKVIKVSDGGATAASGPAGSCPSITSCPLAPGRRSTMEMLHPARKCSTNVPVQQRRSSAGRAKPSVRREASVSSPGKTSPVASAMAAAGSTTGTTAGTTAGAVTGAAAGQAPRRVSPTRRPSPVRAGARPSSRSSPERTASQPPVSTRPAPRGRTPLSWRGQAPIMATPRRRSRTGTYLRSNSRIATPAPLLPQNKSAPASVRSPSYAAGSPAPCSPPLSRTAASSPRPLPARHRRRSLRPRKRKKRMLLASNPHADGASKCRFMPVRYKATAISATWNCSGTRRYSRVPWNGFSNPEGGIVNPLGLSRASQRPRAMSCLRKREVTNT